MAVAELSVNFNLIMTTPTPKDDSFHLYDLKVTVICPPGERILCGARDGDYFTLEGEMLFLPPNQGISIYSLSELPAVDGTRLFQI